MGIPKTVNRVGSEAIERLHFLTSLPLASSGQRKGCEKTQPFIVPNPVSVY